MRGQKHSAELKAEVMAALALGESLNSVARKYQLSKSVVGRIRDEMQTLELGRVGTANERELGQDSDSNQGFDSLLLESLRDHLRMQKAITDIASEPEYLRRQTASDLAKLLEVSQDHTIRLLEAASEGQEEEEEE